MNNVILNERNIYKNIISDNKEIAFAWASYYANHTDIFVNGINYHVDIVFNSNIEFSNGEQTGLGNWVIFKDLLNDKMIICDKNKLNELRKENPLTGNFACFSDKTFGALTS